MEDEDLKTLILIISLMLNGLLFIAYYYNRLNDYACQILLGGK